MITLICGLPGSGKTTYAEWLMQKSEYYGIVTPHINADMVRKAYCDWDFSEAGRERQARRMKRIADECLERRADGVYLDFVCPTPKLRAIVGAEQIIFMDTIKEGRYADTNALFIPPTEDEAEFFQHITEWPALDGHGTGGAAE